MFLDTFEDIHNYIVGHFPNFRWEVNQIADSRTVVATAFHHNLRVATVATATGALDEWLDYQIEQELATLGSWHNPPPTQQLKDWAGDFVALEYRTAF
jgi:hypothetical protein